MPYFAAIAAAASFLRHFPPLLALLIFVFFALSAALALHYAFRH